MVRNQFRKSSRDCSSPSTFIRPLLQFVAVALLASAFAMGNHPGTAKADEAPLSEFRKQLYRFDPVHPAIRPAPPYDPEAQPCSFKGASQVPATLVHLRMRDGHMFELCMPNDGLRSDLPKASMVLAFVNPARIPGLRYRGDLTSFFVNITPFALVRQRSLELMDCQGETIRLGGANYELCHSETRRGYLWRPDLNDPETYPEARSMPMHVVTYRAERGDSRFGFCSMVVEMGGGYAGLDMSGHDEPWPLPIDQIPEIIADFGLALKVMDITDRPEAWLPEVPRYDFGTDAE